MVVFVLLEVIYAYVLAGNEGPVTRALLNLILEDMKSGPVTVRVAVPY